MDRNLEDEMKMTGNTVLITGGATGIGLAMAKAFGDAGNQVLICGRRKDKLDEAGKLLSKAHTFQCDLSTAEGRQALYNWSTKNYPELNILVNNAGIQRPVDLRKGLDSLTNDEDEIEINLRAPIFLSVLFIPTLMERKPSAIVNITSGLGFVPLAFMPVYCATKAAMHSFSLSLRHQLRQSSVKVFEVIPPTTDTELDKGARGHRGQTDRGIPSDEVARAALQALEADNYELAVGAAQHLREASRSQPEEIFRRLNGD
jgi:uncharacterized oxidoreductase